MMSTAAPDRSEGKLGSLEFSAMSAIVALGDPLLNGVSPHKSSYLQQIMGQDTPAWAGNWEKQKHTGEFQWTTSQRRYHDRS